MIDDRNCTCSSYQQSRCAHWRMGNCPDKPMPENVRLLREPNLGNGGREAVMACFPGMTDGMCDSFLAKLWVGGFKVVPLEPRDERS